MVYVCAGGMADLSASIVSAASAPSVRWLFRNSSIQTVTSPQNSSTPYYTLTSSGSGTTLTVHGVDRSVLGQYTAQVSDGVLSRQSNVWLSFLGVCWGGEGSLEESLACEGGIVGKKSALLLMLGCCWLNLLTHSLEITLSSVQSERLEQIK